MDEKQVLIVRVVSDNEELKAQAEGPAISDFLGWHGEEGVFVEGRFVESMWWGNAPASPLLIQDPDTFFEKLGKAIGIKFRVNTLNISLGDLVDVVEDWPYWCWSDVTRVIPGNIHE